MPGVLQRQAAWIIEVLLLHTIGQVCKNPRSHVMCCRIEPIISAVANIARCALELNVTMIKCWIHVVVATIRTSRFRSMPV